MARIVESTEIANAIFFLPYSDASFITRSGLMVDVGSAQL